MLQVPGALLGLRPRSDAAVRVPASMVAVLPTERSRCSKMIPMTTTTSTNRVGVLRRRSL